MNELQYNKKSQELFEQWQNEKIHINKIFVKDGVINPKIFFNNKIRPLFILKEAYGKNLNNNDITKEHCINNGENIKQNNNTWPNISRWTYAILNTTNLAPAEYKELDCFKYKKNEYLQKIAVINVKKSNGKSASSFKNLKMYATNNAEKEYLRNQITIIDPTVIICGNTLSLFLMVFPEFEKYKSLLEQNHYAYISLNGHKVLLLDCYHPSCRKSNKYLYDVFSKLYYSAKKAE